MQTLQRLYELHVVDQGKQPALLVLLAFVLTFVTVRIIVHWIRSGRGPLGNLEVGSLHIHHLVWGILLLLITGFVAIGVAPSAEWALAALAIAFGIGAALTLDEFALWLHLQDVYWEKEGRKSVDAVIIAAALVGMFVLGSDFLVGVIHQGFALDQQVAQVWLLDRGDTDEVVAISAAATILTTAGLWLVFDKAGQRRWLALVPLANFYGLIRVAGKPAWWIALWLLPPAGLVVQLLVMLAVARRFGHGRLYGVALALVPALFLVYLGASRDQYAPVRPPRLAPAG